MSNPGDGDGEKPPESPPLSDAFEAEATVGTVDELYGHVPTTPAHEHVQPPPVDPSIVVASELTRAGDVDEQLLPPVPLAEDLRDAVGAAPARVRAKAKAARAADDEPAPEKRNRKLLTVAALSMLGILIITTFALLGHVNATRYVLTCSTERATAQQGRSFPPWGTQAMNGAEWKPIALPPNAECKTRETDTPAQLEGWYLDLLLERASATLNTPNLLEVPPTIAGKPAANPLDVVSDQLAQALLLSRAPEHHDQRKEVERMLGDVQYWRATLRLRDASAALLDASKQFETAAQQRPRYVTDAAAWASYLKKLADDVHAGPHGAPPPVAGQIVTPEPNSDHPSAPVGTALPVEPPAGEGSDTPPPAPDAGVPTGGVLL